MNLENIKNKLNYSMIKSFFRNYKKQILIFSVSIGIICGICAVIISNIHNKTSISDNKAEEYFYSGKYSKAIDEYKKISRKKKGDDWWNVKIAEIYSVKGDLNNSRKYIEKAKKDLSEDKEQKRKVKSLNYIIFTEFMNKDYKSALEDGQGALKKYPKDNSIAKTMFTVYMANGDTKAASNLIYSYPVNKKSAYGMAEYSRMLMIVGKWDEGIQVLRKSWDLDKDEYKIYDVLSQSYNYNKDVLLEKITNLSTKDPNDVAYKMWLAKIYSLNPDTCEQADKLLNSIDKKNAGKIEINLIQASILQNTNNNNKADELISSIIKKYPEDYRVLHTAGWYYLNKKDYSKALDYCKKSIIRNKDYPDNYGFLMPEILKAEGKNTEGEPYFRISMSKEPYNYNIMLNIANYYSTTSENISKSIEYFNLAQIIKPSDGEIKYSMANAYINAGKFNEAIQVLNQCIKIDSSVPKYHRTLGAIYLKQNNAAEGIKETRLAYQADLQDILTLNNAGCYYVTYEADLIRGIYNLQKSVEGINSSTDPNIKKEINENYSKVKKLQSDYSTAKANDKLQIPDLTLFY